MTATDVRRLLAARQLLVKALADEIAAEGRDTRLLLEPDMLPGEKVTAVLPSGDIVGKVQLTEAPVSAVVVDPAALMEYVKRARPDEIEVTESIRPGFLKWVLDETKRQLTDGENVDGLVIDRTGEVIPGVDLNFGTPSYRPEPSATGKRILAEAITALLGRPLHTLLALSPEVEK